MGGVARQLRCLIGLAGILGQAGCSVVAVRPPEPAEAAPSPSPQSIGAEPPRAPWRIVESDDQNHAPQRVRVAAGSVCPDGAPEKLVVAGGKRGERLVDLSAPKGTGSQERPGRPGERVLLLSSLVGSATTARLVTCEGEAVDVDLVALRGRGSDVLLMKNRKGWMKAVEGEQVLAKNLARIELKR